MVLVESSGLSGKMMAGRSIASHAGVLIQLDPGLNQRLCKNGFPHALPKEQKKNKSIQVGEKSFFPRTVCAKLIYQECVPVRQVTYITWLVELATSYWILHIG